MGKHDIDHRADQLNSNNDAYWTSRGWDERPDDWQERTEQDNENVNTVQPTSSPHKK